MEGRLSRHRATIRNVVSVFREYPFNAHFAIATALLVALVLLTPSASSPLEHPTKASPSSTDDSPPTPVVFRDDTLAAGIAFSHLQGDERLTGVNETLGAGACAFDYDDDGWTDLFLVNGTGQTRYYGVEHWWHRASGNALYRNIDGKRFQDVTAASGLNRQAWGMGCAAADFDNDGDQDLLITNYGPNLLYRNNGDRTFTDVTGQSGMTGRAWSTSAAVADFDGDGLLDVYVTNYVKFEKGARTYERASQFQPSDPRAFSPDLFVAQSNRLYRNRGDLRFEDVTEAAGVGDASGRGLSAAWLDFNGDQRPDLLVGNGAGTTNVAYINRGGGQFNEAGERYLLNDARGSNGLATGDINGDGHFDVAVSTGLGEPPLVLANEPAADRTGRAFRNRTRELGIGSDLSSVFSGWGIALRDFNNDGRLDLLQVNGLLTPDPDTSKVPQGQPKCLWLQQADSRFRDASAVSGVALSDTESARGLAIADFDNDGDLDAYVANNNAPGQLLTNLTAGNHWLGVVLEGHRGNRDAVGAVARLEASDGSRQYRRVASGGFLSSNDRRLLFGLGAQQRVTELAVTWPNGDTQVLRDPPVDRYLHITEGESDQPVSTAEATSGDAVPALGLRLANTEPAHRVQYLKWVMRSGDLPDALTEIEAALRDDAARVRVAAVRLLRKQRSPRGLALAVAALNDPKPGVRLEALETLRVHESEASVRWLLRAFEDPDPRVRADAANVFGFFFDEEEAVIHRKFLAVPRLIRLLEDGDAGVRASAAHALGAAERYRAVAPLVTRLEDTDAGVRAAAVESLGLIRERQSVGALRAVADDFTEPPPVRSRALIALKRLDALGPGGIDGIYGAVIEQDGAPALRDFLEVLKAIFADPGHGVVLNRDRLVGLLERYASVHDTGNPEIKILMAEVLELAAGPVAVKLLKGLADDPDAAVRERAYTALVTIDRGRRAAHYQRGLKDPVTEVRLALLRRLESGHTTVPAEVLLSNLADERTRSMTLRALRGVSNPKLVTRLHRIATDRSEEISIRAEAIESLIPAAREAPPLPKALLAADTPGPMRAAAIRFWSARAPGYMRTSALPESLVSALRAAEPGVRDAAVETFLSRRESWSTGILSELLSDRDADPKTRRAILNSLDDESLRGAEHLVASIARTKNSPLRAAAITALARTNNPAMHRLLWTILNDPGENTDMRFAAARALQSDHGPDVLARLRSQ